MRRTAFESTVAEHGGRVFTLAVYLLNDREEAEDVTQDVLVRLWQKGHEVDPERVGAWLMRVTRNRCIDAMRSRTGLQRASLVHDSDGTLERAVDCRPGPETRAHASEIGSIIHDALAALPEPYRSVVVLREIQGHSYHEISDILEMPLNSVRVTLHRGRRQLRRALREEYEHAAVV
jgi:RNA polymerase sigma-70 factor (ECF subfamily)